MADEETNEQDAGGEPEATAAEPVWAETQPWCHD